MLGTRLNSTPIEHKKLVERLLHNVENLRLQHRIHFISESTGSYIGWLKELSLRPKSDHHDAIDVEVTGMYLERNA